METSLEAGPPIEVVTPRNSAAAPASAYPAKEVMLSRRRRELLVPLVSMLVSAASALLSSKSGFQAGLIVGMVAAVLCLYQCYRVLKAREAPPSPPQAQSRLRRRCARVGRVLWLTMLTGTTVWAALIGVLRVASYFEANLLERGVCNWGCVRVSLFRSENCEDFCSPLLLRSDQQTVHTLVRRWLAEQPSVSTIRTVEKDNTPKKAGVAGDGSAEEGGSSGSSSDGTGSGGASGSGGAGGGLPGSTGPTVYTYGVSLSTLIGFPSELGVETSCMPLPMGSGNSTGVLVSVQAQQLFRVGFPAVDVEKAKVKALLAMLREAADSGLLPAVPCS